MPEPIPEELIGPAVENIFNLRQLENATADEVADLLADEFDAIAARIAGSDIANAADTQAAVTRLADELRGVTSQTWSEVHGLLRQRLQEIGLQQSEFAAQTMDDAVATVGVDITSGRIAPELMRQIITENPFEGAVLREWAENQAERQLFQVRRQIQLGLANNETIGDLVRRVRGRALRPGVYTGGVLETTTREATALVRTSVNHISNRAHQATYASNQDVTTSYRYTATLDERTTFICMGLDGEVFEYGEGPEPPQHFNALPTGSQVQTRRGRKPIEQVRVGDEVWTHAGRWRRVYAAMGKRHDSGMRRLTLSTGRVLRVTDEHPVLTLNAGWKRADEVCAGDEVVQYREKRAEMPAGVGVSEVPQSAVSDAHDGPPLPHEAPVSSGVLVTAAGVSASVKLKQHAGVGEGEVGDVGPDGKLEAKAQTRPVERVDHLGFVPRWRLPVSVGSRLGDLLSHLGVPHRIVGFHALRVHLRQFLRRLRLLKAPVLVAARVFAAFVRERCSCALTANRNVVAMAGAVEGGFPHPQVAFNGADAFPTVPMTALDELANSVGLGQVDVAHGVSSASWVSAQVTNNVAESGYGGHVWNLAVEQDETYVADGVVVHNCRSTTVPVVDWERLGVEPPPEGTRASAGGQVKSSTTYEDWLGRQSAARQDEILGPSRARLFRENKVGLNDLVRGDGRRVNVADLPGGEEALKKVRGGG